MHLPKLKQSILLCRYHKKSARFPDPVLSKLQPDRHFGAVSERIFTSVKKYMEENPDKCLTEDELEERLPLNSIIANSF